MRWLIWRWCWTGGDSRIESAEEDNSNDNSSEDEVSVRAGQEEAGRRGEASENAGQATGGQAASSAPSTGQGFTSQVAKPMFLEDAVFNQIHDIIDGALNDEADRVLASNMLVYRGWQALSGACLGTVVNIVSICMRMATDLLS